jgi:integrase
MGMLYRKYVWDKTTRGPVRDSATDEPVRGGLWWMKYYDNGKPICRSTGKLEKREALLVLRKAEARVAEGQREAPLIHRIKFEDLIEDLKREYQLKDLKTWCLREQHLARLHPMFGGMRVKAITTPRLQDYILKRQREGAASATINRELDCLHRMMVLGVRQSPPKVGPIPHFPKLTEDNVREGFLEHDEFLNVRGAAPDHLKVAMTIAYYTGMRMREIISARGLRWDQVNLEERSIRLSSSQTKTKSPRVIYMAEDFLKVICKAKELRDRDYPTCPFVCHLNGKPFDNLIHGWKTACKRVGLVGKTFHDLRRTGVRNLVRAGVPETVAMKISGHKTRSVFDRYNITSEEDLKEAASRLGEYIQKKAATSTATVPEVPTVEPRRVASQPIEKWRRGRDLKTLMLSRL